MAFTKTKHWHVRRINKVIEAIQGTFDRIEDLDTAKAKKAHIEQAISQSKELQKMFIAFKESEFFLTK